MTVANYDQPYAGVRVLDQPSTDLVEGSVDDQTLVDLLIAQHGRQSVRLLQR